MKKNILYIIGLLFILSACDLNYQANPNEPEVAPSNSVFNSAVKASVDDVYDEWFSGRFTLGTMQYWSQTEYTEEDRYQYRESMRETWEDFYFNLESFRKVIELNTDEATKNQMSAYGDNNNQIAASRIMMAWIFNVMADTWGDVPYWSLTTEDADFQALKVDDDVLKPAYAPQSKIYPDLLKQLKEAAAMIDVNKKAFNTGDPLYQGDSDMWKKFANSLRLRIAMKVKSVYPEAATHITEAIADGVFTSNADNAILVYEGNEKNGSRFQRAFQSRLDFAVTNSFMRLLNGDVGGFAKDPRQSKYAESNQFGNYVGVPNGADNDATVAFKWESLPNKTITGWDPKAAGGQGSHSFSAGSQALMTYSEVEFLLSENSSWAQANYENAVKASLEQWGVDAADVTAFVAGLPAASEANVMTQKYIALYMQGHTAWVEYRRTGFPKTLTLPNTSYSMTVVTKDDGTTSDFNYTFTPLKPVTDLPFRMEYPQQESTLNGVNYKAAVDKLDKGNEIDSKLWWM